MIKTILKLKTLKQYYLEFKEMMNCNRIWFTLDDNSSVNIKADYKFFIHMIGIQKIPFYKKADIKSLIKKIESEEITFDVIKKRIKAVNLKNKNLKQSMKFLSYKLLGLQFFKSLDINTLIKNLPFFSFDDMKLKKIFLQVHADLFWFNKSYDGQVLGFLLSKFKNGKYKLENFCCLKSFIYFKHSNCCLKNKNCKCLKKILLKIRKKEIVRVVRISK